LVSNHAHPGGNITGLSTGVAGFGINSKVVDLLKGVIPTLARVGMFYADATTPNLEPGNTEVELAAQRYGGQILSFEAPRVEDFGAAIASAQGWHADALFVLTDGLTLNHQHEIATLALSYRLPTACQRSEFVHNRCLMAYGANRPAIVARAATYVGRILRGANPGDLPIEQPTVFDLTVNRITATALGTEWVD
jgi:putative ABC transport system substrate-binding protein